MAQYAYRARTADGRLTKGILRAPSADRATALLRSHGLTPVEIKTAETKAFWDKQVWGGLISTKDLILFSRQIASMIRAGVPILEALQALSRQVTKRNYRQLLQELIYDIEGGESLSNAMARHPKVFSPFFLGVVRTGEASGRLSETLTSLADYLEQDYIFMRKVRSALVYPVFVLTIVVILSVIMMTFVLPQLTGLFAEAGVQLPWPTRVLIAVSSFITGYWLVIILVSAAAGVLLRNYIKTPEGRYTLSTYVLQIPIISQLFRKIYLARVTSILHTLFQSDVPVIESLQLAKAAVGNRVYQRILEDTTEAVKDGATISSVWENEVFIPPLLTTMVGVGERSGEVANAFAEANRFFRSDVEAVLDSIAVLLEPILVIILGIGVAIVVAAVLLPIYNLVLVL